MSLSYCNPVWPHYFADPFVLRWGSDYYAYGTAEEPYRSADGRVFAFAVLRSNDLVRWTAAGGVLELSGADRDRAYWAPEVAAHDGSFLLYYSSAPRGRDELHRIHVARAGTPLGPFEPRGPVLPESEGFCIDAHPFRDPVDGRWYLFFARDYFEERTGTGVAVAPLADELDRVAGPSRAVVRATADWQIYERNRTLYGRSWEAWHTVEGPCVVFRAGRYYCFYSGGNWQTGDYGVGFASAAAPAGPWQPAPDEGPVVLRQRPGRVLGPGHNSHAVAPDGTEFLVYHAWDPDRRARRMCIDPLEWTPSGPRCLGPTDEPRQVG